MVAASTENSLVRWVFEQREGNAPAAPPGTESRAVLLENSVPGQFKTRKLQVTKGTPATTEEQEIDEYDPAGRVARVKAPYALKPDSSFACGIVAGPTLGPARDGFTQAFVLHDGPAGE